MDFKGRLNMNIGIFIADIEFRTGGSESYFAGLLSALQKMYSQAKFEILTTCTPKKLRTDESSLAERLSETYGFHVCSAFKVIRCPIKATNALTVLRAYRWMRQYSERFDMLFNCSRNLMTFKAKKNISIMHFPVQSYTASKTACRMPFLLPVARRLDEKWKESFDVFLCNSHYTERHLKKIWGIPEKKISVVYPPVGMVRSGTLGKKRQIIVCSRIEPSKSLHVLVEAFTRLDSGDVTLAIVGAKLPEDEAYYQRLVKIADGYDVVFHFNPSRRELEELYRESLIFWHAKGLETEESLKPDLLEHFGITTVEAMSAGCIPVVIDKGGQQEIVDEGINGFKWNTTDELLEKTRAVLANGHSIAMQKAAEEKAQSYNFDTFCMRLENIFGEKK
ncbi:MAG: glycosyltransferase family 4 protein [Treponema sp.]|nr:glycosyltransferase family 4 protein [Treponema sp.]